MWDLQVEIGGRLLTAIGFGLLGLLVVKWWAFRRGGR